MTKFTLPTIDYTTMGQRDQYWFYVGVEGFWSEPITISVSRSRNGIWSCEVTHSSGGYQGDDRLMTEENFANAIFESIKLAREIQKNSSSLEAVYQAHLKILEETRAREQAEMQAKLDADPAMSRDAAIQLVNDLKTLPRDFRLNVYGRGSESFHQYFITDSGRYARMSYRKPELISKSELIDILISNSYRSCYSFPKR